MTVFSESFYFLAHLAIPSSSCSQFPFQTDKPPLKQRPTSNNVRAVKNGRPTAGSSRRRALHIRVRCAANRQPECAREQQLKRNSKAPGTATAAVCWHQHQLSVLSPCSLFPLLPKIEEYPNNGINRSRPAITRYKNSETAAGMGGTQTPGGGNREAGFNSGRRCSAGEVVCQRGSGPLRHAGQEDESRTAGAGYR